MRGKIDNRVAEVQGLWLKARAEAKDETLEAFAKGLDGFGDWLRDLGRSDILGLYQATRGLDLPPAVNLSEDRDVLIRGLYVLACIQLQVAAIRGLNTKNRKGFDADELELFAGPMRKAKTPYRSNYVKALEADIGADPHRQIEAISGFLRVFVMMKARMPSLTLASLEEGMTAQAAVIQVHELTAEIDIAAKSKDPKRLEAVMSSPRNAAALEALRDVGRRKLVIKGQQDLGDRDLVMGSDLGHVGDLGRVSVAYAGADRRLFVEFAGLKPHLFYAPDAWLADRVLGQKITEIHDNTIGMVHLTGLMFAAMGYLPVLIEAGFAGLIYEIAFNYASQELEEKLAEIDPVWGRVLAFAITTFAPRPNFHPKFNDWADAGRESSLLADELNVASRERSTFGADADDLERSLLDTGVGPGERALEAIDPEIEDMMQRLDVRDDVLRMNAGIPLTRARFRDWIAAFKPGQARIPPEWRRVIAECKPLQKMMEAAWADPEGAVSLVRITEKQGARMPYKYQTSVMGSDHELWVTLDGVSHKFDGIIQNEAGQWFIGESKFTFKDMMETTDDVMRSFEAAGKANPATSYHFTAVEKAKAQFERYAGIAERFGFDGVAVITNTDFVWATFQQELRDTHNVEIFVERLSELEEFAGMFANGAESKATGTASKAAGAANRATGR